MKLIAAVAGFVALGQVGANVQAQTTQVNVRVVSHDAKIIGDGVGGARILVRNPETGEILAEGIQRGGTGNTATIVVEPHGRGETVYASEGAAVFTARLELQVPTVLEFIGEGPLGYQHAMQRTMKRMLVVPGEDILGDGVLLELHGFIVELLEPESAGTSGSTPVTARVRMLCGCPHTPGGLWDADRIRVTARIYDGDRMIREATLRYAGEPNLFSGSISLDGVREDAHLVVLAHDADRANFGMSEKRRVGSLPKTRQFPTGVPKVCAPSPRDRSDACTLLNVRSQSP